MKKLNKERIFGNNFLGKTDLKKQSHAQIVTIKSVLVKFTSHAVEFFYNPLRFLDRFHLP